MTENKFPSIFVGIATVILVISILSPVAQHTFDARDTCDDKYGDDEDLTVEISGQNGKLKYPVVIGSIDKVYEASEFIGNLLIRYSSTGKLIIPSYGWVGRPVESNSVPLFALENDQSVRTWDKNATHEIFANVESFSSPSSQPVNVTEGTEILAYYSDDTPLIGVLGNVMSWNFRMDDQLTGDVGRLMYNSIQFFGNETIDNVLVVYQNQKYLDYLVEYLTPLNISVEGYYAGWLPDDKCKERFEVLNLFNSTNPQNNDIAYPPINGGQWPVAHGEPLPLVFVVIAILLSIGSLALLELPSLKKYTKFGFSLSFLSAIFGILAYLKIQSIIGEINKTYSSVVNGASEDLELPAKLLEASAGVYFILWSVILNIMGGLLMLYLFIKSESKIGKTQ